MCLSASSVSSLFQAIIVSKDVITRDSDYLSGQDKPGPSVVLLGCFEATRRDFVSVESSSMELWAEVPNWDLRVQWYSTVKMIRPAKSATLRTVPVLAIYERIFENVSLWS